MTHIETDDRMARRVHVNAVDLKTQKKSPKAAKALGDFSLGFRIQESGIRIQESGFRMGGVAYGWGCCSSMNECTW